MSGVLIVYQTDSTKILTFFIANNALHLSQYCMKYCIKKTLTEEKIPFNYGLSRNRFVIKNVFGIWISTSKLFTTLATDNALVALMTATFALRYTIF